MVFDLRGRRKRVIQVAYAILALLMAFSLFTVVGPLSIGDIFGGGSSGSAGEVSLDRAEQVQRQLAKDPQNETLLLRLVQERITAGNNLAEIDPQTGQAIPTSESQQQYEQAAAVWDRYLKLNPDEPSPNTAQQAANTFFLLAQGSTSAGEAQANLEDAAEAQGIVAKARPNLGTLSTYAIYSFFSLDFAQGDEVAEQAVSAAPKSQRKGVTRELASYRKQAKKFEKELQAATAQGGKEQAQEQLDNPLGGLSGGGTGLGAAP